MPVRPQRPFKFEAPKCSKCGANQKIFPHNFCWDEAAPPKKGSMLEGDTLKKSGPVLVSNGRRGMHWEMS